MQRRVEGVKFGDIARVVAGRLRAPNMRTTLPVAVCALLSACSNPAPTGVREPAPSPAVPSASDAAALTADAPPPPPPPPTFSIAERLPDDRAVVFAEHPGETVTLHPAQGADVTLRDGEVVTFIEDNAQVGGGDATATIEAHGVRGTAPNARILNEARLTRSPDGRRAVFYAIATCGDLCHAEVWLLGVSGERTRVTSDAGPGVVTSWRPDNTRVAIGSGQLFVVNAADGHVTAVEGVTAPVYASDGALFARGATLTDDAVYELTDGAPPRRIFGAPGRPPAPAEGSAREDPTPAALEQDGRVLRAFFTRGSREVMARASRDGRPATGPSAAVIAVEGFIQAQLRACNESRARLHEQAVFPEGTAVRIGRPVPPRAFTVRIERPGVDAVEVVADATAGRIRSTRGPTTALPGGLDFCPAPVWVGPHND